MSIFRELLSIKTFRENKAEMEVRKQRMVLAEALARREQAQAQLDDFRGYALRHEQALFTDLCTRIVRLRDIEAVQTEVVQLRQQERGYESAVDTAVQAEHKESGELDVRKQAHAEASRMKQKFVELAQVYADEQIRELERKEDAELEEAAETRRDRADWDERSEEAETA